MTPRIPQLLTSSSFVKEGQVCFRPIENATTHKANKGGGMFISG
jgi:hypothetical protein